MAISGRFFNWKNGVGVAEISDLPRPVTVGLDKILFIISHKTGKTEGFYLNHVDKDRSGEDIYGYHFLPMNPELVKKNVRVLLIND